MKRIFLVLLFLFTTSAFASLFDGKYSQNQVFDVARSGCYSTGGPCSVSNMINPYIAPYTNWTPMTWASGDYVQFYDAGGGQIGLKQFASNGTAKGIISSSGYVQAIGSGIVYIGVPNVGGGTGYFISNSAGFAYGSSTTVTDVIAGADVTSTVLNNYSASTTPLAAGQTATPTPQPTPIYYNNATVRITNVWPTSNNSPAGEGAVNAFDNNPNTKYLNFDKQNAGVTVKLNTGRVVNGFTITTANDFSGRDPTSYKLYGSNDGVTWVLIQEGALSLSNNRYTTSSMINITNSTAYAYYYIMFPTTKAGTGCGLDCDSMQIAEITYYYDANNTTTSTATGGSSTPVDPVQAAAGPSVEGGTITQTNASTSQTITSGGSSTAGLTTTQETRVNTWINSNQSGNNELYIEQTYGSNNSVTITQTGDKNRIDFTLSGNGNVVNSTQTGRNYLKEDIPGWGNSVTTNQTNTSGGSNYAETRIQGNGNTVNHTQTGTGNHLLFSTVSGDINTVTTTQSGSGNHFADIRLTGNHNTALVDQSGSTQNKAYIELTNAGGPASVDLLQTGGKNFSIIQSCTNPLGCTTVVRQQ